MRWWSASAFLMTVGVAAACNGQFGTRGDDTVPLPEPPGPRPTYGATVSLSKAPPAISGGTLLISRDKRFAIAADPDRDRVVIVDVATRTPTSIALSPGDEPGRAIEDDAGRLHVVLRGGGGIATIDLGTKSIASRRAICATPRGIAYHPTKKLVYVACAGGELVGIAPDATTPTMQVTLEKDLRDIVVIAEGLAISTFRAAHVLTVTTEGALLYNVELPPAPLLTAKGNAQAAVASRMIPMGSGELLVIHQRARDPNAAPISTEPGGYAGRETGTVTEGDKGGAPLRPRCGLGIVHSAATLFRYGGQQPMAPISTAVLPVDAAFDPVANDVAFVAAGNGHTKELPQIYRFDRNVIGGFDECLIAQRTITPAGQAIAATFLDRELIVQLREPSMLVSYDYDGKSLWQVALGGESREDTGHAVFHSNAGSFMACASCHPEGGDDGRVWSFANIGPRRTQSLRGGIRGSEPFHWAGELKDLNALVGEVFARRMSGPELYSDQVDALARFIDGIPYLRTSAGDAAAVARGKALFESAAVGCNTCHVGAKSNNTSVDVGTGGVFQVPSLRGIAARGPFMHTGCAPTLVDRFLNIGCGGGEKHGTTKHLARTEIDDLVAYLEAL